MSRFWQDPLDESFIPTKTTVLEYIRFGLRDHLGAAALESMTYEEMPDRLVGGLTRHVTFMLQSQRLGQIELEIPYVYSYERYTSWWQTWKAEHGGRFLGRIARRWPPQTRTVERHGSVQKKVNVKAAFPESSIVTHPDLGRPIYIAEVVRD